MNMNPTQYGGWNEEDKKDKFLNLYEFEKYIEPLIDTYIKNKFENKTYNNKPITNAANAIQYLRENINEESIIDEFKDDLNYNNPKFSILPKGTTFFRRQTKENFDNSKSYTWLDYTGTIGSGVSFLKDTNNKYTQEYLDATIEYFGKHLLKIKTTKPLVIFHYPSTVTSSSENLVRHQCIHSKHPPYCADADGYTLDFLKFNPNKIYKDKESLDGFRELCILNSKGNLEKIEEEQNAGKRKSRRNRKSKKGKKSRKARKSRRKSNHRRR